MVLTPRSLCFLSPVTCTNNDSFPSPHCDWSPFELKASSGVAASDRLELDCDFKMLDSRLFIWVDGRKLFSEVSLETLTLESFKQFDTSSITTFTDRLAFDWDFRLPLPKFFFGVEGRKELPDSSLEELTLVISAVVEVNSKIIFTESSLVVYP